MLLNAVPTSEVVKILLSGLTVVGSVVGFIFYRYELSQKSKFDLLKSQNDFLRSDNKELEKEIRELQKELRELQKMNNEYASKVLTAFDRSTDAITYMLNQDKNSK